MRDIADTIWEFGPFRLFLAERRLEKDGRPVRLGSRALDLLLVLAQHAGDVVPSRTLLEKVWRDVTVEESSLRFHIKNLRRALGDGQSGTRYVTNVPGRGYCLAAPIHRVLRQEASRPVGVRGGTRTDLPASRTVMVGRAESMHVISNALDRNRLVTISGPAGIGKTTLAIAAAQALRGNFDDAVRFVDLAPVEDPSLVVSAVVSALGLVLQADDPVAAIVEFLRGRRILIVLDNCEQAIEAVAGLADRILQETADTHMLVTSRESLRIAGERMHRLAPLECPPIREDITANEASVYAAVRLFVDRAAAGGGTFSLDDASAPAVAEICRRLDGIPLAIELAAARVEFLGVSALASGLDDMFAVLTQGRRFALPRHQTLRATLDWGYHLLSATEQAVLRRIAIFRASFTLASALAVVTGPDLPASEAEGAMADLVAKSLLNADGTGDTAMYRLLEATRLYATEKRAASGEAPPTARRHAEHHLALVETAPPAWQSDDGKQWLRLHTGRIDDIRVALDWSFSPGGDLPVGLRLTASSIRLWLQLSLTLEYVGRIERALRRLAELPRPDDAMELRLQIAFGYAIWYSASRRDRLEATFARAMELARQVGDVPARLQALWGMWAVRRVGCRYREALAVAEEYEAMARAADDQAAIVLGDRILGLTHHFLGNQKPARNVLERVLAGARRTGVALDDGFQLASEIAVPVLLTRILWLQGFPDQARTMLHEAIGAAQRADHWFSLYYTLCLAGCPFALWTGDLALAQTYLDMMVNHTADKRWRACWAFVLRLRLGGAQERLVASFLEPRLDFPTSERIAPLASLAPVPVPQPEAEVGDTRWSLPEILRVNAELLLWHGGKGAAQRAEELLLRSLEVARQQSTLSWELRSAMSLAQLWRDGRRAAEARDLVAAASDRFTEGLDTGDVIAARRLLAEWP